MPKKEDSESESLLLSKDGQTTGVSYTEEGCLLGPGSEASENIREMDYVDTDVSVYAQFHEDALAQGGFGLFQCFLFCVLGLGLAADSIEVFVIAYVLPSAEKELCMDDYRKGWLAAISFFGMMIGGLVWGTLGDKLGRRRTLVSALTTNAVFAVATAFMPTYGLFMLTRLCSGIGVGGSLPIVFTYYSEFLVKRYRGRHLSWLLTFWGIGGVYTALMAWLMITEPEANGLGTRLSSWRVFLVVCAAPALLTVFGLFFLPESPRYLLEVGRDVEAVYVYQKVRRINGKENSDFQLSEMELPPRRSPNAGLTNHRNCFNDFLEAFETFWGSVLQVLCPPFTKITMILMIVWVTTAFGFYGMSIWFPEYIRKLEEEKYDANATVYSHQYIHHKNFTALYENIHFESSRFKYDRFENLILNHVIFIDCTFEDSTFNKVLSSKTFFFNSNFTRVTFDHTDFYDYRFVNCIFKNSSFDLHHDGCGVDVDLNYNLTDVFMENLIAQLAIIPGNIVSSFILDRFGRVKTMATSLFLTSLSAFFIWFLDTRTTVIAFEALFNFISISGWNAVDVITTESYPVTLRATGYGLLSAISRVAAILGNFTFAYYINISKALPILTTAAVLLVGAICSLKLDETKDALM
ncbi:synaptic vesicle glycoprotein 2B-like [Uloborus diversus]|uniref:synaptic vesicle glycoprotein 2B-like n=1 Tax=Uloborus diversus TaxID=327109 RepID=UPI0024090036|nr:synaptic vesicle glycoprotein 2B-like [Uloborus diversus]